MMIAIKLTRPENLDYFTCTAGATVQVDMEEYVAGVVASEIGNAPLEACKALAIAARTLGAKCAEKGENVTDKGSTHQAFRASRWDAAQYPNANQAAVETAGMVLTYGGKLLETCSYSASNGGHTVSSKERWGRYRPYLIAQIDPWDEAACLERMAAGESITKGHGVGMSQYGAAWAAEHGQNCREILAFYYQGTTIAKEYGRMAKTLIPAWKLLRLARQAADEKWGYIWGESGGVWTKAKQQKATREQTQKYGKKWIGKRVADCSGLLVWMLKECGGSIYHGSNTIWRQYLSDKGNLTDGKRTDGQELKPMSLVFQMTPDPKQDDGEDQNHVGIYIGGGLVVEAKQTKDGVLYTVLVERAWEQWGELAQVDYSAQEESAADPQPVEEKAEEAAAPYVLIVGKGGLNVRKGPGTEYAVLSQVRQGDKLPYIATAVTNGWHGVEVQGEIGWVTPKQSRVEG